MIPVFFVVEERKGKFHIIDLRSSPEAAERCAAEHSWKSPDVEFHVLQTVTTYKDGAQR